MKYYLVLPLLVALFFIQCKSSTKSSSLTMTSDELVRATIELYTVRGLQSLAVSDNKDSLTKTYYVQVAKNIGKPMEEIEANFNALIQMPDSLVSIQNRALDTMRHWQSVKQASNTPKSDTTRIVK